LVPEQLVFIIRFSVEERKLGVSAEEKVVPLERLLFGETLFLPV
jgi:hypothetical protein